MKILGWIFAVLGVLNLIVGFIAAAEAPEAAGQKIMGGITIGILGIFLITRAKKKEQEKEDIDKWNNR